MLSNIVPSGSRSLPTNCAKYSAVCLGTEMNRGMDAARAAAAMVEVFDEIDRSGNLRMHPSNV